MIDIITVKLFALGSLAVKTALPSSIPIIAMSEGMITADTGVPLTIVAAVGGACWYLNGRFVKIETQLKDMVDELNKRPCATMCPSQPKKDESK